MNVNPLIDQHDFEHLVANGHVSDVWDNVWVGDQRHLVIRIEGRPHSTGGRWGDNEYYSYPFNEPCVYENLCMFSGHVMSWGIQCTDINRIKCKWGETRIKERCSTSITLNGEHFMDVPGIMEYAIPKAQCLIVELSEGAVNFAERDWRERLIGRKVYVNNQPGVITQVCNDINVIIVPDGVDYFEPPCYLLNETGFDLDEWRASEGRDWKTSILDSSLYLFRD